MSDHGDKVTEERVQEWAAQIRERLRRWEYLKCFDVEAAARRALTARSGPKPSAHDLLKAVRPEWEKEAARQQLTGEPLVAFKRQILESETPQVAIDTDGFGDLRYHIHLNKAAVETLSSDVEIVSEALEWATPAVPEVNELISPIETFIRAEVAAIQSIGRASSTGQAQLVGSPDRASRGPRTGSTQPVARRICSAESRVLGDVVTVTAPCRSRAGTAAVSRARPWPRAVDRQLPGPAPGPPRPRVSARAGGPGGAGVTPGSAVA